MAERVGFEPTLEFPLNTLSKRAPSATRPSLRRESFGKEPLNAKRGISRTFRSFSILWVKLWKPQLGTRRRYDNFSRESKAATGTDGVAEALPTTDAPAAAALAAPFAGVVGNAGTFVLSTT